MRKRNIFLVVLAILLAVLAAIAFVPIPRSWANHYIRNNNVWAVQLIFRLRPATGYDLLDSACGDGRPEIVEMLLDEGLSVDGKNLSYGGWTPLYRTAAQTSDQCLELLLSKGADPNILVPWNYDTAIFALVPPFGAEKHPNAYERRLELLFRHGANPNAVDKEGNTLLHRRFSNGDGNLYYYLYPLFKKHGYDPTIKNKKGQTIVDILKMDKRLNWELINTIEQDLSSR